MTNAYRKIGEGVTDSNGRITVSYTGKGAGKIQLVAKQGSLLSETYDIVDCLKYDLATSTTNNDIYYGTNVNLLTRGADYSEITQTNDTQFVYIECNGDICIEFDANVNVGDSSPFIAFTNGGTVVAQKTQTNLSTVDDTWIHYKIEVKNNVAVFTSDYNSVSSSSTVTGYNRFRLRKASGETFKFRKFMVYPI